MGKVVIFDTSKSKGQVSLHDIGASGNLSQTLNDSTEFDNVAGFVSIGMHVKPPTGGAVTFEGTFDGVNWEPFTIRSLTSDLYFSTITSEQDVIGSIAAFRKIRLRTSIGGSAAGDAIGRMNKDVSVIESIEFGFPPHKIGYFPVKKDVSYTTAQTDTVIWTPASGKRFVLTDLILIAGGNTDGVVTIFDETNASGNILFKADIDVVNNNNFRFNHSYVVPIISAASDNSLKITTSAGIDIDIVTSGYEI